MAIFCIASWLPFFILSPLHSFNYHQLAPVIGLRHTCSVLCLLIEAGLCTQFQFPFPCSTSALQASTPYVASGLALINSLWEDKLICQPAFKPPAFKPPAFKSPFSFHLGCGWTQIPYSGKFQICPMVP